MGRDKATIEIDGINLLTRVVAALTPVARAGIVVVAAADQELATLPSNVVVVRDETPFAGPLVALERGIAALDPTLVSFFLCATDLPRLDAAVVARIVALRGCQDAAVPETDGALQPLAAAYSVQIADRVSALVARGERSMRALLGTLAIRRVTREDLLGDEAVRTCDPGLASLTDVDTPMDLEALRTRLG